MTVILWTKKWAEKTKKELKFFKTLKSSNNTAKELKNISEIPLLLIAQKQTQPYGRKKRQWIPSDFMATWTWQNTYTPSPVFSPLLGLALYNAFQQIWPSDLWSLKAPNDIYLADKKTAGLLLETQVSKNTQIIFGLGINVLEAPSHAKCISNYHAVDELLWRNFLEIFWQSLLKLNNRNISKISLEESKSLTKALRNHSQYKNLVQIQEDGSLIFKDKTVHWLDL